MSYKVNFKENVEYLRVEISGTRTRSREVDDAIKVWSQVAEIGKAKNITHILAIIEITGFMPTMASFDIGNLAEKFGWRRSFKLAVVTSDEESRKANLFTETVAVNRGFDVKIFDNEQNAKIWLLDS